MTETMCYSNTLRSQMERLRQANSVLLAEAVEREKELSLLREAVGHCYGIVTEPSVTSMEGKEARAAWLALALSLVGDLLGETTSEQQSSCQCQCENPLPPNCS